MASVCDYKWDVKLHTNKSFYGHKGDVTFVGSNCSENSPLENLNFPTGHANVSPTNI